MDFDPHETWLGISDDRRPHTHYDLPGLSLFASDAAAIEQAALGRMRKVRQHQIGPQSDRSQEILSELARARLILMDPDRRAEYDADLRTAESQPVVAVAQQSARNGYANQHSLPPIEAVSDPLSLIIISDDDARDSLSLRPAVKKGPPWWANCLVTLFFLSLHAGLFAVGYFFIYLPRNAKQTPSVVPDNSPVAPTPKPPPSRKPHPRPEPNATGRRGPPTPPPVSRRLDDNTRISVTPEIGSPAADPKIVPYEPKPGDVPDPPIQEKENPPVATDHPDTPEAILKQHGLSRRGAVYRLDRESDVFSAEAETQRQQSNLTFSRMLQQAAQSPEQRQQSIYDLEAEMTQCNDNIQGLNRQKDQFPRPRGAFANNLAAEEYYELLYNLDQAMSYRRQLTDDLNRLRHQPFDPEMKQKADAQVEANQAAYDQARHKFLDLVKETKQKYKELAENDEVKRALNTLSKNARVKLAPSREFSRLVKRLEQPEKKGARRNPRR